MNTATIGHTYSFIFTVRGEATTLDEFSKNFEGCEMDRTDEQLKIQVQETAKKHLFTGKYEIRTDVKNRTMFKVEKMVKAFNIEPVTFK